MNKNIASALFRDAFAQVVDNMMFRILIGLLMLCVVPTFLVGFREDSLVVLYFWQFPYEDLMKSFGGSGPLDENMRDLMVRGMQAAIVDLAAGKMGILLSVAATAFFMPRTLEKGAADTVFSKPVSRLALMMSRYFAGLIFVAILAVLLVGGMHIGFLVSSGYSDPGFLWSILTLIYIFAVMHAFSIMIGIFTRSSVAALLLTMIFFLLNSCVHGIWEGKESGAFGGSSKAELIAEQGEQAKAEEERGFVEWLVITSDVLHYTLPKTGDAERMARILRRGVEDRHKELVDSGRTDLTIDSAPAGFVRDTRSSLVRDGALWIAEDSGAGEEARIRLALRPMTEVKSRVTEARRFLDELEEDPALTVLDDGRRAIASRRAEYIEWQEERGGETRLRRRWYFQSGSEWLFTLDYDAEAEWAADPDRKAALDGFLEDMHFPESSDPFETSQSYGRKFGFQAEWKYNAWFSIATTLAFLLLTLLAGWWKLARIDF